MRKIKIDNKIYDFDISDGKGDIPFSCNGVGGERAYLNDVNISDNCFVENHNMLDGKVNFKEKNETINCSFYKSFEIDDIRYKELKGIHSHDWKEYGKIPFERRLKTILFGLRYFDIDYIGDGYHFGKELTYTDFCVCFSSYKIIVFASSHNGYIVPEYLELCKNDDNFDIVFRVIKKSIREYFDI
jgi:hypothetical protein